MLAHLVATCLLGEIVGAVEAKGIMNNTLLIFLSDNGGSPGDARGQNLPLRGRKMTNNTGGKFEGGVRTASFMYGGYLDSRIGADTMCDYNGMFYVADWFPTLLQLASNNTLRNDEMDALVGDTVAIDGIGLWPNILSECGLSDGNPDAETVRDLLISARTCGEGENDYFISTCVRSLRSDICYVLSPGTDISVRRSGSSL